MAWYGLERRAFRLAENYGVSRRNLLNKSLKPKRGIRFDAQGTKDIACCKRGKLNYLTSDELLNKGGRTFLSASSMAGWKTRPPFKMGYFKREKATLRTFFITPARVNRKCHRRKILG
jgi:hypothetical protein